MRRPPLVQFHVSPELHRRLQRFRSEHDINLSAWLRRLVARELDLELGPQGEASDPGPDRKPDRNRGRPPAASQVEPLQARRWLLGVILPGRHRQAPREPGRALHPDHDPAGRLLDHLRVGGHRAPGGFRPGPRLRETGVRLRASGSDRYGPDRDYRGDTPFPAT